MTVDRGKVHWVLPSRSRLTQASETTKTDPDTMAPIWDETAQQKQGLPSVTVGPKHDESRRMKGVEWVRSGAAPVSLTLLPSIMFPI